MEIPSFQKNNSVYPSAGFTPMATRYFCVQLLCYFYFAQAGLPGHKKRAAGNRIYAVVMPHVVLIIIVIFPDFSNGNLITNWIGFFRSFCYKSPCLVFLCYFL